MTIRKLLPHDMAAIKKAKEKITKLGTRSISDIITSKKLTFKEKVDFIRHTYTYYNGNFDLFLTPKGKPNSRKYKLNSLIMEIIRGKADPSALKNFNKQILRWRKAKDEQKNIMEDKILSRFSGKSIKAEPKWRKEIKGAYNSAYDYIKLIETYLQANPIDEATLNNISYKTLKKNALTWNNLQNRPLEYVYINSVQEQIKKNAITPGNIFRNKYLDACRKNKTNPSEYLNLLCKYLDSPENYKYRTIDSISGIGDIKSLAMSWAILKIINNDKRFLEFLQTMPESIIDKLKRKADKFLDREQKDMLTKMKEYAKDLGYESKEGEIC